MNAATPATSAPTRVPPHNYEAEQALLGAILMNNRALERVVEFLRPEHFAEPLHGRIYQYCVDMSERNKVVNPVTLKTYLGDDQHLKDLGGDAYLVGLAQGAGTIINSESYGRLIFDLHLRRELIALGEDMINDAYDADGCDSANHVMEMVEGELTKLSCDSVGNTGQVTFAQAIRAARNTAESVYKSDGKLSGLSTGLVDLDIQIGGLHDTDLIILAGRPGMGKSALALDITATVAKAEAERERPCVIAFFSLEMSAEQLGARDLSRETGIPSNRLRDGPLSDIEMERICDATMRREKIPILIDETPAISVQAIRSRARRIARKSGLSFLVIDYLQLIGRPQERGRRTPENRTQEVSEITRALKALAKELKVPVLALSQLSRQVEMREDKRPHLSDLRDSGSIEQDADQVLFIYREEYYLKSHEPTDPKKIGEWEDQMRRCKNIADIIVAKNRHGPTGSVRLFFDSATTKFGNVQR